MQRKENGRGVNSTFSFGEWILFSIVTVLLGLSIFDRNPITTLIVGAGWLAIVITMIIQFKRRR